MAVQKHLNAYIIAGAPSPDIDFIRKNIPSDAFVLCADRGYTYARMAGITPQVIIGDFDSCKDDLPEQVEITRLNREKQYTDTVHCIDCALEKGFRDITLLAAIGGRLDHTYANLCALSYTAKRGGKAMILSEREEIRLLSVGSHSFCERDGLTFSLFPFGTASAELSVSGAHYPLSSYRMESDNPIGVSNVFEGACCAITVHSGSVLMIINRDNRYL